MARKIFVSYKHGDSSVRPPFDTDFYNGLTTTRDYVDCLMTLFAGEQIYKGEGNEDLSEFKDETIRSRLKDKIWDSSVTIVLISPEMKDPHEIESDQWIPWEISYSLKAITRGERTSKTNAMLAVVLPSKLGGYNYYYETHSNCNCRTLKTYPLFEILKRNMFNRKNEEKIPCSVCGGSPHQGDHSYIPSVKWDDFISNKEKFLEKAREIWLKQDEYNIVREISH